MPILILLKLFSIYTLVKNKGAYAFKYQMCKHEIKSKQPVVTQKSTWRSVHVAGVKAGCVAPRSRAVKYVADVHTRAL